MTQIPTIGRIVHVVLERQAMNSTCREPVTFPAIVTSVDLPNLKIRAMAFTDSGLDGVWPFLPVDSAYRFDETATEVNSWRWPPVVPAKAQRSEIEFVAKLDTSDVKAKVSELGQQVAETKASLSPLVTFSADLHLAHGDKMHIEGTAADPAAAAKMVLEFRKAVRG